MKVEIDYDEFYPVYYVSNPVFHSRVVVDVDEEKLKSWKAASDAYVQMQEEMAAAYAKGLGVEDDAFISDLYRVSDEQGESE
jgi:hypothetical protein